MDILLNEEGIVILYWKMAFKGERVCWEALNIAYVHLGIKEL